MFTCDSSECDQDPDSASEEEEKKKKKKEEEEEEEEDFQTVLIDDEHWTTEMVPERTFCLHENGLPNNVCQYPCPYGNNNTVLYMDSLDLIDISDYEDYMMTTSDEQRIARIRRGTILMFELWFA